MALGRVGAGRGGTGLGAFSPGDRSSSAGSPGLHASRLVARREGDCGRVIAGVRDDEGLSLRILDLTRLTWRVIGKGPPLKESEIGLSYRLFPAGTDGYFAVTEDPDKLALWFKPEDETWREVIGEVPITKTFGGRSPYLPASYVGGGRFAISRTTRKKVEFPEDWNEEDRLFGAAEAETILLEGKSGRVLARTAPFVYFQNPPLKIPKSWWADGLSPESPFRDLREVEESSLFTQDDQKGKLSWGKRRKVKIPKDGEVRVSEDGRYAVVLRRFSRRGEKEKVRQRLRVVDGKTGQVWKLLYQSSFHEILTSVHWLAPETGPRELAEEAE